MKKLAIVIPHYNGEDILRSCIQSLQNSTFEAFNIYVVDNGSSDHSVSMLKTEFPEVMCIQSETNLGYAGGCNLGAEQTKEPYILFYNNDTELEPDALDHMFRQMENNHKIGALQPKLRSFFNKELFDYSGACGGEIDMFGYPFARGRMFDTIEEDTDQYNELNTQIFWASGTAMLVRRTAIDDVGLFDEAFFAHMEEIDLSWRMQHKGWEIHVCPNAVVYHYSGYTLGAMNPKKMYLNHRNNLLMLYKNLPDSQLLILKKRLKLEYITFFVSLIKFDFKRAISVVKALVSFKKMRHQFTEKRQFIQQTRTDKVTTIKAISIVRLYFLNKIKKYSDIQF